MHVRVLLSEDLCNRSPGSCALVIQEEAPYPLPEGGPTDGLPRLTRQYSVVIASCHVLVLLLSSTDGPALPGGPLCLVITHQACLENHLPEVHPSGDLCLDLLCPVNS